VFLLTSLWEGLPIALLQSMTAGVPVVATAVDGTKEAVIDNVNGFIVPCHDIDTMTARVETLLDNKDIAEKFVAKSKEMLKETFEKRDRVEQITELYIKELGNKI